MGIPDFKDHENCNAMQCHPSLYYVIYLVTLLFAVQRNVLISLLWFLFSGAASNEHSQLVEIPVERSSFKCNIQKSVPRSLQLKKMLPSRIEMCS